MTTNLTDTGSTSPAAGSGQETPPAAKVETPPVSEAPKGETTNTEGAGDKSADKKPDAEGAADPAAKEVDGKKDQTEVKVPEKYEDFKLPEGFKPDPEFMETVSDIAKEAKLDQEGAQKIADKAAAALQKMHTRQQEAIASVRTEWQTQTKADTEFGGDKLDANLAVAKKALDAFGTPELKKLLNDSGLGDHPEVIRTFFRVGKGISEDGMVVRTPGTPAAKKNPQDVLYDKS